MSQLDNIYERIQIKDNVGKISSLFVPVDSIVKTAYCIWFTQLDRSFTILLTLQGMFGQHLQSY